MSVCYDLVTFASITGCQNSRLVAAFVSSCYGDTVWHKSHLTHDV